MAEPGVHNEVPPETGEPIPGPDIDLVWDKALKLAKGRLGNSNLLLSLANPTSQSGGGNIRAVIEALDTLQEDENKKRWSFTWRGEKVIIVDHLRRFLKAVEPYSTVVGSAAQGIAVQGNLQLAAVVWAGVLAIMRVCINLLCQPTEIRYADPMIGYFKSCGDD